MDAFLPSLVNFKCISMYGLFGSEMDFDNQLDFIGNFTFTFFTARDNVMPNVLCGEPYIVIKEMIERTRMRAIPIMINTTRFLKLKGSEELFEPELSYIYEKDVDFVLHHFPLHPSFLSFTNISYSYISPSLVIMGGLYPNNESNPLFGIFNIFYIETWIFLLFSIFISCLFLTSKALINRKMKPANYLVNFGKNLWTVWNSIFIQNSFKFKNLEQFNCVLLFGILLLSKIFLLNLFSSEILSITITNPFQYIDSIEDLKHRPNLQPVIFASDATVLSFQGDHHVSPIVKKAFKLPYDYHDLYSEHLSQLVHNISIKQSHVMLASQYDSQLIIKMNPSLYSKITHLSSNAYLDEVYGYLLGNNIDPLVAKTLQQIMYSLRESGITDKSLETALITAYDLFADKEIDFTVEDVKHVMKVDQMKIALGPYIVGILFSIFASMAEMSIH